MRGSGHHGAGGANIFRWDPTVDDPGDIDPVDLDAEDLVSGLSAPDWDGRKRYDARDTVSYQGDIYRAKRNIDAPWLLSNDSPDKSPDWEISRSAAFSGKGGGHHHGGHGRHYGGNGFYPGPFVPIEYEIIDTPMSLECIEYDKDGNCLKYGYPPQTILGLFDVGQVQRSLNDLKPVTVEIARTLLKGGQEAITGAIQGAKQPWYKSDLPGETERKNVAGKLAWHEQHLAMAPSAPHTLYDAGDDLKRWVIAAYVDANAVEEGAAYLGASWDRMWSDIRRELAAIPKAVVDAAASAAGTILGVPPWAIWVGGALGVGLAGWLVWKLANSPAGQAAIGGYAGRRR